MLSTLISLSFLCYAPKLQADSALKQRLTYELIDFGEIQSCYIGPVGVKSHWFAKADSLIDLLGFVEQLDLYKTSNNYTIKYYLFASLCWKNLDSAFNLLKFSLNDSSKVFTQFGCVWGSDQFNYLLAKEFGVAMNLQRKSGMISYNCHSYEIVPINVKKRKKEFKKLLKQNNWKDVIDYLKELN